MKSRQAVKAAATLRRYLHAGGALAVIGGVYLGVTGFSFWPVKAGSQPGSVDGPPPISKALALKRVAGKIDGHGKCHVTGLFEGKKQFSQFSALFDTGASGLYFFRDHARRLGYDPAQLRFTTKISTPHGPGMAAPIVLREVRLGHDLVLRDVPALIGEVDGLPGNDDPLLGPSVVGNLHHFEISQSACALFWQ